MLLLSVGYVCLIVFSECLLFVIYFVFVVCFSVFEFGPGMVWVVVSCRLFVCGLLALVGCYSVLIGCWFV